MSYDKSLSKRLPIGIQHIDIEIFKIVIVILFIKLNYLYLMIFSNVELNSRKFRFIPKQITVLTVMFRLNVMKTDRLIILLNKNLPF
jgi:hypothetical protein